MLVLKKLPIYVLFVATREVKLYYVTLQGVVEIASKSISKSAIDK